MKNRLKELFSIKGKEEDGYTLLEYCAGAAVIITVLWAAFDRLGGSLEVLMDSIGTWATDTAGTISSTNETDSNAR